MHNLNTNNHYHPIKLKFITKPDKYIQFLNLLFQNRMTDFGLDDLIKQDKEKKKTNKHLPKKGTKPTGPRGRAQLLKKGKKQNRDRDTAPRKQRQRPTSPPQTEQREPKEDGRRLRVMGLHPDITSTNLFELFNKHGALDVCRVDQDNFGRSLTTATVVYHSAQHAQTAQRELNQSKVMNSTITVETSKPRSLAPKTKKIFKREHEENNFRSNRPHQGKHFKGNNFRRGGFRGRNPKN